MAMARYAAKATNGEMFAQYKPIAPTKERQNSSATATPSNVDIFGRRLRMPTNSNHFIMVAGIAGMRYGNIPPISRPISIFGSFRSKCTSPANIFA